MIRKILHLDLDSFFCAAELHTRPELRDLPFAVGGQPDERGVVASCSYAARVYGVHSAMPMATARRLCPDLVIVPLRHGAYRALSHEVRAIAQTLTPFVEPMSIDEAFLDVTLLPDSLQALAQALQTAINSGLDLPCSLGGASNKLVAKIANTRGKASAVAGQPPNAICVVPPGEEAAFLAPLPVRQLWGVGPATADQLARLGIQTIGDLATWPAADLIRRMGKHGASLARHARGEDDRPVETEHETRSISKETTFTRDVIDPDALRGMLRRLCDELGYQARQSMLAGRTVTLKLRWSDFTTLTRQITLQHTTSRDNELFEVAAGLLAAHWPVDKPVRLIGVGLSGFETPHRQLGLWEDAHALDEHGRLQSTLDEVRARFGDNAIRRASTLRHPGDPS